MLPTWIRNVLNTISSEEPGVQSKLPLYILGYVLLLGFIGILYPTGIAIGRRIKKQNTPVLYSLVLGVSAFFLVDVTYNHRLLSFGLIMLMGFALPFFPVKFTIHDNTSSTI